MTRVNRESKPQPPAREVILVFSMERGKEPALFRLPAHGGPEVPGEAQMLDFSRGGMDILPLVLGHPAQWVWGRQFSMLESRARFMDQTGSKVLLLENNATFHPL